MLNRNEQNEDHHSSYAHIFLVVLTPIPSRFGYDDAEDTDEDDDTDDESDDSELQGFVHFSGAESFKWIERLLREQKFWSFGVSHELGLMHHVSGIGYCERNGQLLITQFS